MLSRILDLGWVWEPSVLIGLAGLSIAYALIVGPFRARISSSSAVPVSQICAFYAATLCVFLVLVSPLDRLADQFLFSAHMAQHIVLTYVAPPLWLMGIPAWLVGWIVPLRVGRQVLRLLARPLPAFLIFNGAMWIWHIPGPYNAALRHEGLHVVEHLTFMAAALIGWWPVVGRLPDDETGLALPHRVVYLFASALPCTALSALITFAPDPLYRFYELAPLQMGVSPLLDQQIGGLIMWLPTDFIFVTAAIFVLYRWLNSSGEWGGERSLG